jgi:hypothetical protein
MGRAHRDIFAKDGTWKEGDWFTRPSGVQNVNVNGSNDLFPSWYSKPKNADGEKIMFDSVSKKKATSCTPERAKVEITVQVFENPLTKKKEYSAPDDYNPNEEDHVHKCDDIKPSVTVTTSAVGTPSERKYRITATVTQGTHGLKTIDISADGQVISSQSISAPGEYSVDHAFTSVGNKSVSATVLDSALYEGSGTRSVTVATTGDGPDLPPINNRRRG